LTQTRVRAMPGTSFLLYEIPTSALTTIPSPFAPIETTLPVTALYRWIGVVVNAALWAREYLKSRHERKQIAGACQSSADFVV